MLHLCVFRAVDIYAAYSFVVLKTNIYPLVFATDSFRKLLDI